MRRSNKKRETETCLAKENLQILRKRLSEGSYLMKTRREYKKKGSLNKIESALSSNIGESKKKQRSPKCRISRELLKPSSVKRIKS